MDEKKKYSEGEHRKTVDSADELVKEKNDNEFIACENTAQYQIFVQNANFNGKSDFKKILDLVNLNTGNDKKYNLKKMKDCAEFFNTCKNREYIALAIVLSIFDIVPIGDYTNLKDVLIEYLPVVLQTDKEGKEIHVHQANPYAPLNIALSVIGGKIFITDAGQQCIGYGEDSRKVLNNIWIQLPDLRKPIISWLLKINEMFEYKTSFEVYQIVGAFVRIIAEDFQYAKRQVFDKLYSNPNNLGLLARLAQELLIDEKFRTDTLNIVIGWADSESNWLWKSALLVCLHTYDSDIDKQLQKAMVCAIKKRMYGLQNSELRFITLFAGSTENVRTIMAFAFDNLYKLSGKQGKEDLAFIYLKMIRYGYYQVNRKQINLPFALLNHM